MDSATTIVASRLRGLVRRGKSPLSAAGRDQVPSGLNRRRLGPIIQSRLSEHVPGETHLSRLGRKLYGLPPAQDRRKRRRALNFRQQARLAIMRLPAAQRP